MSASIKSVLSIKSVQTFAIVAKDAISSMKCSHCFQWWLTALKVSFVGTDERLRLCADIDKGKKMVFRNSNLQ